MADMGFWRHKCVLALLTQPVHGRQWHVLTQACALRKLRRCVLSKQMIAAALPV